MQAIDACINPMEMEMNMKASQWTLSAAAFAMALMLGLPAQAQTAAHDHGAGAPHELSLNQGQKWGTDAPLRKGMENLRGLVAPQLEAAHAGQLKADQYRQLAGKVEHEVAFIVKNCKLAPAADDQLHLVIADIGAGVDAMNGKTAGASPTDGLLKVTQALNQYQTYFNHPGFRAIPIAH